MGSINESLADEFRVAASTCMDVQQMLVEYAFTMADKWRSDLIMQDAKKMFDAVQVLEMMAINIKDGRIHDAGDRRMQEPLLAA